MYETAKKRNPAAAALAQAFLEAYDAISVRKRPLRESSRNSRNVCCDALCSLIYGLTPFS